MDTAIPEDMRTTLRGPVIGPRDAGYDQARKIYNAMIDKRPAALVPCADAADVVDAVAYVRDHGLELAVRGGGHSGPGLYREFLPQAPEDVYRFFAVLVVPPGPPFPEELHGKKVCGIVWCCTGDPDGAAETLSVVNDAGRPAFHFATPMPYDALQGMFDELIPTGYQWYWRGDFFDGIPDAALDVHLAYGRNNPTPLSLMHLYPIDGAAHRVGPDDTAWSCRDALWSGVFAGVDPDPANLFHADQNIEPARG